MEISVFFTDPFLYLGYLIVILLVLSFLFLKNMVVPGILLLLFAGVIIYAFFIQAPLEHILIFVLASLVSCSIPLYIRGKKA